MAYRVHVCNSYNISYSKMISLIFRKIVLACALFCVFGLQAQPLKKFAEGSRVVFVGNSITEAGFYESYIWLYYMTRFPNQPIEVINAGIGGNTAKDILARFDEDVLSRKPTVLVLTFGMNDSGYFEYLNGDPEEVANKKVEESYEYFKKLVDKLKALSGVEIVLMSSSPYDETRKGNNNHFPGKSKAMERIIAFQKKAAEENGWPFVDLYYPMQQLNLEGQKQNPEFTISGNDRIHPGNGGHLIMAYYFLKSQGLAGVPVAEVEIDLKKKKVNKAVNATVSNVSVSKTTLSFDYLANALPFPIDSASRMWGSEEKQSDALTLIPFEKEFNQEIIRVKNLDAPRYELKIDGESLGTWSREDLENGVNIAFNDKAPQYDQAIQIRDLNHARKEIENRLREYYSLQFNFFQHRGLLFKDDQTAYELAVKQAKTDWTVSGKMHAYESLRFPQVRQSLQDQMKLMVEMIYQLNKPKIHRVELVSVK